MTKSKNKTNSSFILTVSLMVMLIAILIVPTTIAWFTDNDVADASTPIKFATVNVDALDGLTAENYRVGSSTAVAAGELQKVLPGDTIKYTTSIKNTGTVGVYAITIAGVRFTYNGTDFTDSIIPYVENLSNLTTDGSTYFYEVAKDATINLSGSFDFSKDLPNEVNSYILNWKSDEQKPTIKLVLDIQVYAIQKDNILEADAQSYLETVSNINTTLAASDIVASTGSVSVAPINNVAKAQLASYTSKTGISANNVVAAADITSTEATTPDLTFDVSSSGLQEGDDVLALHYDENLAIWETVEICEVDEEQKVTVSNLTSLSPVALVAVEDGIGETEENPLPINNAKDFITYTAEGNQKHLKLTSDIDMEYIINNELIELTTLNSKNEVVPIDYIVSDVFTKTIDGDNHKILFPSEFSGGIFVFSDFRGTLKNTVISYTKVKDGENMSFVYYSQGDLTFSGVTIENVDTSLNTNGVLDLKDTATNFSPFVYFVKANNLVFENCVNNLSFSGSPYSSAFLGGYLLTPDGKYYYEDGTQNTANTNGFVKTHVSYINCTNNGNLSGKEISVLQGSSNRLPMPEYLIITNFVNNGTIIGTTDAQLYCAHGAGRHWSSTDYRNTYLVPKNAAVAEAAGGTGTCGKLGITGFEATYNKTSKLITITNPDTTKNYVYDIELRTYIGHGDGSTSLCIAAIRVDSAGLTNIGYYDLVDNKYFNTDAIVSTTEITQNLTIKGGGISGLRLFLITTASGKKVYHLDTGTTAGESVDYTVGYYNYKHTVSAYEVNGETLTMAAQATIVQG